MNIEKLVEELAKSLAKTALNKKDDSSKTIAIDKMDSGDVFKIVFNKLFYAGNYNEAENLLFHELEKNYSEETYEIGVKFYNYLLEKSDDELHTHNFSKKEVFQGLDDIKRFKTDF
ncbi:DUF6483 family protein [Clostridium niameyense]|uniref:DUF6483 family protein n=1 Tax=Clostridium niameyense TaxID=1622073 RepID=UPI00067EDC53|nr:DUF6483 family protein [Clostridium niameyense]